MSVLEREAARLACDSSLPWECLAGATVVVTGATGLIGRSLAATLVERERMAPTGMRLVLPVRNKRKAHDLLGEPACLSTFAWEAEHPDVDTETLAHADFIVHCANETDSAAFLERPVETIRSTLSGATAMLELARRTGARLCLLSTMEVYGEVRGTEPLCEGYNGIIDTQNPRSSYPEAKRLVETLAASYAAEYGVSALCARLAQTFGPGVAPGDGRAFAEFARRATVGHDIVLLTDGSKRNSYLYTFDAVSALLLLAVRGEAGLAYNVANDATYCSVREMAEQVAVALGRGRVRVRVSEDAEEARRFRPGGSLRLDTGRLRALGWQPHAGLGEMYATMVADWDGQ